MRGVWAEINLSAMRHNIRTIKKFLADGTKFCAVVKANAYGHGAIVEAREAVALGAEYLAVATVEEGIELRQYGFSTPILILGASQPEESSSIVFYELTQTVFTVEQAQNLSQQAVLQKKLAKVHLAIDTGMSRIGVRPEDAGEMAKKISALPQIFLEGAFSHFALADAKNKSFAKKQFERFQIALKKIEDEKIFLKIRHIANSAAILEMPEVHLDMARAGIILYGLPPSNEVGCETLRQVMTLKAKITLVKTLKAGKSVGYGCTFTAERDMKIGTLPIGYADGYLRMLAGKASVEIGNQRAKILGRICMDQCMIDLTNIDAKIGDVVTLFGSETLTTCEFAEWLGTIPYEVTCLISKRVPRIYVE